MIQQSTFGMAAKRVALGFGVGMVSASGIAYMHQQKRGRSDFKSVATLGLMGGITGASIAGMGGGNRIRNFINGNESLAAAKKWTTDNLASAKAWTLGKKTSAQAWATDNLAAYSAWMSGKKASYRTMRNTPLSNTKRMAMGAVAGAGIGMANDVVSQRNNGFGRYDMGRVLRSGISGGMAGAGIGFGIGRGSTALGLGSAAVGGFIGMGSSDDQIGGGIQGALLGAGLGFGGGALYNRSGNLGRVALAPKSYNAARRSGLSMAESLARTAETTLNRF